RPQDLRIEGIVPAGRGVRNRVPRVDGDAEESVDEGSCSRGDEDGVERITEPEASRVEALDRLAEYRDAGGLRVVRGAGVERGLDQIPEFLGNREMLRIEVTHGEIADVAAGGLHGADLARDLEDGGGLESFREARHARRASGDAGEGLEAWGRGR